MPSDVLKMFADAGGLFGLVVGSLVIFVLLFIAELRRKDKSHSKFIQDLLSDSRQEREQNNKAFTKRTDKLSDALTDLSNNLRKH